MSARIARDLDGRIPELMARARVPGLSVTVVERGQLAWSGSFGLKHRDSAIRVDNDTVYQAASPSKPAFAFAVMHLVTRGRSPRIRRFRRIFLSRTFRTTHCWSGLRRATF